MVDVDIVSALRELHDYTSNQSDAEFLVKAADAMEEQRASLDRIAEQARAYRDAADCKGQVHQSRIWQMFVDEARETLAKTKSIKVP